MVAIFIAVMSLAAFIQFAVAQWRAVWIAIASQPLSDALQDATGIAPGAIGQDDFNALACACEKLSRVPDETHSWLRQIRAYYRIVSTIQMVCARAIPAVSAWASQELVTCSRYAAVLLDQRLNASAA